MTNEEKIKISEEMLVLGNNRAEFPWHWGERIQNNEKLNKHIQKAAIDLEIELLWGEPIRPGDTYLAIRNTGVKLLTCDWLGEACVFAKENAYAFNWNECVKIKSN